MLSPPSGCLDRYGALHLPLAGPFPSGIAIARRLGTVRSGAVDAEADFGCSAGGR